MKKPVFEGTATAIVTPFKDSTIDYEAFDRLLDFQLSAGIDAIVVCGTTGESAALTDAEKISLIAHTIKYTAGRCKIIAGTGSNNTAHSLELSRVACSLGTDALLLVTPYYNKCTQAGLAQHFLSVADAVTCPCIVYNVPSRTSVDIHTDTCRKLAAHPNLNGIKEAGGDFTKIAHLMLEAKDDFHVWCGNDDQTVPMMSLGAKGVISVVSNVKPVQTFRMTHAALKGDFETAKHLQFELLPLIAALFREVNPIPVKAALELLGFSVGVPRLPLTEAADAVKAELKQILCA